MAPKGYIVWIRNQEADQATYDRLSKIGDAHKRLLIDLLKNAEEDAKAGLFDWEYWDVEFRSLWRKHFEDCEPIWFRNLRAWHDNGSAVTFKPAGESIILYRPQSKREGGSPKWYRVSLLQKITGNDQVKPFNMVFADFASLSKGLRSSEAHGLELMLRQLAKRRKWVFALDQSREFVETISQAVHLADQRLITGHLSKVSESAKNQSA
jgi:hypothetical protein